MQGEQLASASSLPRRVQEACGQGGVVPVPSEETENLGRGVACQLGEALRPHATGSPMAVNSRWPLGHGKGPCFTWGAGTCVVRRGLACGDSGLSCRTRLALAGSGRSTERLCWWHFRLG